MGEIISLIQDGWKDYALIFIMPKVKTGCFSMSWACTEICTKQLGVIKFLGRKTQFNTTASFPNKMPKEEGW
jgi:hypothetical protein